MKTYSEKPKAQRDFIVENKVVLELKTWSKVIPAHEIQQNQYLVVSKHKIGYDIDLGSAGKLELIRTEHLFNDFSGLIKRFYD